MLSKKDACCLGIAAYLTVGCRLCRSGVACNTTCTIPLGTQLHESEACARFACLNEEYRKCAILTMMHKGLYVLPLITVHPCCLAYSNTAAHLLQQPAEAHPSRGSL